MGESAATTPGPERLLAVIDLQNAIAAAGMNGDEVLSLVVDRAASLTAATGGMVALVEGDEIVYRAVSGTTRIATGTRVGKGTSVAGRSVAERRCLRIDDPAREPETLARSGGSSMIAVPLLYGEAAVGVLEVVSTKAAAFSDEDTETLRLLAQIIAIALHRAYTYPRPKHDSEHDALTGLANRRAFDERVQAELLRNKRYKHSFSLAVLDLDGLESANDRFGQAAGDEALRQIALILKKHTRVIDACFRIGADEFAIVMPGTSLEGAHILAERCRAHILEARLCEGAVTSSFGVVEALEEPADALGVRATAALTADKQARRAS